MTAPVRSKAAPRRKLFRSGPWLGMRHNWRAGFDERFAYLIANMMPVTIGKPGPWIACPPTEISISPAALTQWLGVWKDVNRAVIAGEIWDAVVPLVGQTWTKRISTANLTAAGITLSATTTVYAIPFGDTLLVTDGINTAFTWNGTAGGGLTKLTNAPVFFGRPTVYYGKVVGIKNTQRDTLVWSEENQANTGYEAGGFNNAWSLTQTGGGAIIAVLGTNAALYYGRRDSIGSIRGAVTPDFKAAGVHDDITRETGVGGTEGMALIGQDFWFADGLGRPWRAVGGAAPSPLWENIADAFPQAVGDDGTLGQPGPSAVGFGGEIVWLPTRRLVFVHWPFQAFAVFDAETGQALFFWVPPRGMIGQVGVALRVGQLLTVGPSLFATPQEQIGFGYNFAPHISIDAWPPPIYAVDQYPFWTPGATSAADPFIVAPPFGGGPFAEYGWLDVMVEHYFPRARVNGTMTTTVYASAESLLDPPDAYVATLPDSLVSVGAQVFATDTLKRRNQLGTWGLNHDGRQLLVGVGGPARVPWGIEAITAVGVPFEVVLEQS